MADVHNDDTGQEFWTDEDFDSCVLGDEEIEAKEEALSNKRSGFGTYILGMGTSTVRVLPILKPAPKAKPGEPPPKKSMTFSRTVQIHKRFMGGDSILCIEETRDLATDEKCPICEFRRRMGNQLGWKSELFKKLSKGLNLRPDHAGLYLLQIVKDCGDKGDEKFPRKPPESGSLLPLSAGYTLDKGIIALFKDPEYRDALHPIKGRDLKIARGLDPKTGRPSTTVTWARDARPVNVGIQYPEKKAPLTVPEILDTLPNPYTRYTAPTKEQLEKVNELLKQLELDIRMGKDVLSKGKGKNKQNAKEESPQVQGEKPGPDPKSLPEPIDVTAVEVVKPTRSLNVIAPTKEKGPDGKPLCYNKGAKDGTLPICVSCPEDVTCDED